MIHVLIADDHALVRKGLKELINDTTDMCVVGEAVNGVEALELVLKRDGDVLILDLMLPLRNGIEVLAEVSHTHPALPVLVLSVYPEQQFGIRMLQAGAAGYMNKSTDLMDIVGAVRKVVNGGRYMSPDLAEHFATELSGNRFQLPHESLSTREYSVMCLLAQGKSPTLIAQELALSVKTISTYRSRILLKLGLKTNATLIRYVMDHDLLANL